VTFEARHAARHRVLEGAQQIAHLLRIEAAAELGRADQVDEHHRQLASLGVWSRRDRWRRGRRHCRRRLQGSGSGARFVQCGDGFEQEAAVTDRGDPDLLEVLHRQPRQHPGVDGILAERRLVPLEP
jgi:hypothetical protein